MENWTPTGIAQQIAGQGGEALVETAVGVLPVLLPIFAAFWGIRYALGKLRLNRLQK